MSAKTTSGTLSLEKSISTNIGLRFFSPSTTPGTGSSPSLSTSSSARNQEIRCVHVNTLYYLTQCQKTFSCHNTNGFCMCDTYLSPVPTTTTVLTRCSCTSKLSFQFPLGRRQTSNIKWPEFDEDLVCLCLAR